MINNIYQFIREQHQINIDGQKLFKYLSKSNRTKYMIFIDVESDGLWGTGFCVSMIVIDVRSGNIIEKFIKRTDIEIKTNWVKENVLPVIKDVPKCNSLLELREEFWNVWEQYRKYSVVFADAGLPVETNWFRDCIMDDLENRRWKAPYPLHDVATTVLMSGIGNVTRKEYSKLNTVLDKDLQHNPYYDNLATAITLILTTYQLINDIGQKIKGEVQV